MSTPEAPASLFGFAIFKCLSVILMGTSLGTTYWVKVYILDVLIGHDGLFAGCNNSICVDYDSDAVNQYHPDLSNIHVIQVLCLTAIVLYIINLIIMAVFVFVQKMVTRSRTIGWVVLAISLIGGFLATAGVGRYDVLVLDNWILAKIDWDYEFGYSFYLALISAIASGGAGLFAIISVFRLYRIQQLGGYPPTGQVLGAPVGYVYPPVQQYPVGGQVYTVAPPNQGFVGDQPPAYDQKPSNTY